MNFLQYARGVLVQIETGLHIIPKPSAAQPQQVVADASPAITLPGIDPVAPVVTDSTADQSGAAATLPTMESSTSAPAATADDAPASTDTTAPASTDATAEAPASTDSTTADAAPAATAEDSTTDTSSETAEQPAEAAAQ